MSLMRRRSHREIAKRNRKRQYIETTTELKEVIEQVLSFIPEKERKEAVKKSCQRCFQALRIDVNQEFEVLESFLSKLPGILAPGGRAAILTFHSGEDRLVKYYFKDGKKEGIYSDVASDVIRPSAEECQRNPRARSTKMALGDSGWRKSAQDVKKKQARKRNLEMREGNGSANLSIHLAEWFPEDRIRKRNRL